MTFALGVVLGAAIGKHGPRLWQFANAWRRKRENRRIGRRDDFDEFELWS